MSETATEDGVMFLHGSSGCDVIVIDEHHRAGTAHAQAMNRAAFDRGERVTIDQYAEWMAEGEEASRRRLTMREHKEIEAAKAVLSRHGYKVRDPKPIRTEDRAR
jgi:hypothetical protein